GPGELAGRVDLSARAGRRRPGGGDLEAHPKWHADGDRGDDPQAPEGRGTADPPGRGEALQPLPRRAGHRVGAAAAGRGRPCMTVRPERPSDTAGIRSVHRAAFETGLEAYLVDALREQ